jgi:hypothetical protein
MRWPPEGHTGAGDKNVHATEALLRRRNQVRALANVAYVHLTKQHAFGTACMLASQLAKRSIIAEIGAGDFVARGNKASRGS